MTGPEEQPTEQRSKKILHECHLKEFFGPLRVDKIRVSEVVQFRAHLVERELSEKRINSLLAVLSKALKYAADVEIIAKAPRIGTFEVERPEIIAWYSALRRLEVVLEGLVVRNPDGSALFTAPAPAAWQRNGTDSGPEKERPALSLA